jgi:N-acetylglucosamine-6-sulfatase
MLLMPALLSGGGQNIKERNVNHSKPNIIFILTDDEAWNLLGKDGRYSFMKTPNLDQLSREGMVFQNAFVTTSLSSPSRACIMTGCYAHKKGVYINTYSDPDPNVPFLPKVMQGAGYETSFIGKWHMKPGANPRDGFDYWLSFDGQGQYINPPLNENGRDFVEKGYITDILTDYAIKRIREPGKKPFCLFLWHKAVHAPFTPAPRDSAAFPGALIPEYDNWYDTMEGKPEWLRRGWLYGVHNEVWKMSKDKPVPLKIEPKPWDPKNKTWMNYLRAMLAVDESYGRIRKYLEDLDILDNTVVIFSSDNGYFLGSHQRGDKRLMYEESIRVPLMISYPGMVKASTTNSDIVLNIDLAPTIIDLAGGTIPSGMQGRSMVPLLKGKTAGWRKSFFYEYFQESYAPGLVTATGVRNQRYKYIEFPHVINDINELYDLEKDPGEMVNLINSPVHQSIRAEMKAELERLKKETSYFDPEVYKE